MNLKSDKLLIRLLPIAVLLTLLPLSSAAPNTQSVEAQTPPPNPAVRCWTLLPNSGISGQSTSLSELAVLSSNDAWAIGRYNLDDASPSQPFAVRWNGASWAQHTLPLTGTPYTQINGIVTLASDDTWIVGSEGYGTTKTLILHWDGRAWTLVPSPNPGAANNTLLGVAASAKDDVWAVGAYSVNERESQQGLILHWDGYTWTQISLPPVGADRLYAVAALAPNDVWVVGSKGGYVNPLILHWDGERWSAVSTPPLTEAAIVGLSALSPDNIWAVGAWGRGALTWHWDGKEWKHIIPPGYGVTSRLESIAAVSPDDVWAAGYYSDPYGAPRGGTLIVHWDGREWSRKAVPIELARSSLGAVTAHNGDVWAIGAVYSKNDKQLTGQALVLPAGACSRKPLDPPHPLPGDTSYFFSQTNKSLTGVFLDYWGGHGGLARFGYPVSELIGEVSEVDGKLYTTQYFERAQFEYHPENPPTYNVLLSHLGTLVYEPKYSDGSPRHGVNTDNPHYFPTTNHYVLGPFNAYWEQHGGLPQFGYPISEQFSEISDVNGQPYVAQYFERAVFEYHPENAGTPHEILLRRLGADRYEAKYLPNALAPAKP